MRNISFSLTTPQFRAQTKDVTRRLDWLHLKAGDVLMGCEKCMGRKAGEPLVRLGPIEVVSVRREQLRRMTQEPGYGASECRREGFPLMQPWEFVAFFCESHPGCTPVTEITRIEFKYLPLCPSQPPTSSDSKPASTTEASASPESLPLPSQPLPTAPVKSRTFASPCAEGPAGS